MTGIDSLVKRFEKLQAKRATWEAHWQELAYYCLPMKQVTVKRTPGSKLPTDIYDSTAIHSVQVLAAGLHSYLTNPSSKWFALRMQDKELEESTGVKEWLKDSEDRIFDCLNSSNFSQQIHEVYVDFSTFGTAILYEEEDPKDLVRFFARPPSECYLVENERGEVDTMFRFFSYTARQAHQRWGDKVGEKIKKAIEAKKYEESFDFLHIILPREERDVKKKDSQNKPFASIYVEISKKKKLSEGGYEEFPFFSPRFAKSSKDAYGYSPAMIALPDIKMLNAMSKTIIQAGQKQIDPPIVLPDDGYILPFNRTPSAINYKRAGLEEKVEVLEVKGNIPVTMELEEQRRSSIKRTFFVDLFLLLAQLPQGKITATEVVERVNEKMLILGPTLGRLMHELLDPIITRTFNILARNQKLAPAPEAIRGKDYKIEYISPLAKAQRVAEAQSISQLLLVLNEMANASPEVLDNIDFDKTAREYADIYNVSGDILRSDEEIQRIREERRKAAEVQRTLEEAKAGAEATEKIAKAEKDLKGGK